MCKGRFTALQSAYIGIFPSTPLIPFRIGIRRFAKRLIGSGFVPEVRSGAYTSIPDNRRLDLAEKILGACGDHNSQIAVPLQLRRYKTRGTKLQARRSEKCAARLLDDAIYAAWHRQGASARSRTRHLANGLRGVSSGGIVDD